MVGWFLGFVSYICRILVYAVFFRAILSWFTTSRSNVLVVFLDHLTEPILSPLRRMVPRLGVFDITALIAIAILYAIPPILKYLLA
ncbi:YggT family protein [Chloroflexota bacterium]